MKKIHTLVCLLLAEMTLSQNSLTVNTPIATASIAKFKTTFYGFGASLGTGKESTISQATFLVDLGLKDVIIGEKARAGWGIVCDGSTDNSCAVIDKTEQDIAYFNQVMTTNKAEMFLRLDQQHSLEVISPKVDKLPLKLVVGGNKWVIDDWGVLGLSPSGSLSKFLGQAYGPNTGMVLKFHYQNANASNEELKFDFNAYLNPKLNQENVVNELEFAEGADHWTSTVDVGFISEAWSFKKAKLCFASTKNEILLVADAIDRCKAVQSIICNGKTGEECVRPIVDLAKAPTLRFEFGSTVFEFTPEEYIYFSGDVAQCRFGSVSSLVDNGSCDQDTVLGVGNLFYQKFIPVLKFNSGGKSSITFLNKFEDANDNPNTTRVILLILGGLAALLAIGVIAVTLLKKRDQSDDIYYGHFSNEN
jgi:hypothetical protein